MLKRLVKSIYDLVPLVKDKFYTRHLFINWRKRNGETKFQKLFWECVKSTYKEEFEKNMEILDKKCLTRYKKLMELEIEHLCKATFSNFALCDIIDNNLRKAFNGRMLNARCKSIITMLEEIRVMIINGY